MTRLAIYFLLGFLAMLLQTTVIHWCLPAGLKPDLLLILVIYLGINEPIRRGSVLAYTLGCLQDVFAGSYLGLYGFVFLVTFLAAGAAVRWFNTESSRLLVLLVLIGTFFQGGVLMFALGLFAEPGEVWPLILGSLLPQAAASSAAAFLVLRGMLALQRRLGPRIRLPGLERLDSRHGF